MMRVIPFDFDHVDIFEQTPEDVALFGLMTSESPNPMAEHGIAFTAIEDGRILVMGGILQTSAHTGKCWTAISKYAQLHGANVFRQTKQHLENMMEDMRLHRLETANLKEAETHHRWCKLLGFTEEGEMPCYDDKKRTWVRYAKLRG